MDKMEILVDHLNMMDINHLDLDNHSTILYISNHHIEHLKYTQFYFSKKLYIYRIWYMQQWKYCVTRVLSPGSSIEF